MVDKESIDGIAELMKWYKMPAGSLARPREIFFKKCGGGIDNRPAFVYI